MIANLFKIKDAGAKGKGLFATQFIPKGTIVYFDCKKCKRLNTKKELAKLSKTELRFYNNHGRYCDDRMLYNNHSCNANVMDLGNEVDIVVRDIKKGEEQTEDYRIFNEEKHFDGGCKCGEKNCIKNTTYKSPAPKKLRRLWDVKIRSAIKSIPNVKQPLKKELLKEHPELSYLFKKW